MGLGRAGEVASQHRAAIALIAVLGGEGEMLADYKIAPQATADERHEIAEKLREIARRMESS